MRRPAHTTVVAALLALLLVVGACSKHDKGASTRGTATTTTVSARPPGFIALGDSFTSGGGAPPYDVDHVCGVSAKGWPYLLDQLDPQVTLVKNRACGGAGIDQLLKAWPERNQGPQIPSTPDPTVGLVVFSIGGNDTSLVLGIAACATLDCSGLPRSERARANYAGLTRRLVKDLYPALRTAFPKARLVQVGYPRITSASPASTCPWLSSDEQTVPDDLIDGVNSAIAAAARESGEVEYLDLGAALKGHELCTEHPWENDLDQGGNSLHPTAEGYVAIAKDIYEHLAGTPS